MAEALMNPHIKVLNETNLLCYLMETDFVLICQLRDVIKYTIENLTNKKDLYSNISMFLEILLEFLGSLSVVERGFSTLGKVLCKNRLFMKNKRLNQSLLVQCNMPALSKLVKGCD